MPACVHKRLVYLKNACLCAQTTCLRKKMTACVQMACLSIECLTVCINGLPVYRMSCCVYKWLACLSNVWLCVQVACLSIKCLAVCTNGLPVYRMPACVHKRLVYLTNACLCAQTTCLRTKWLPACKWLACLSNVCLCANRLPVYRCLSVGKSVVCLPMPVCVQIGCLPGVYLPMCKLRVCHMLVVSSCSQYSETFFTNIRVHVSPLDNTIFSLFRLFKKCKNRF